MTVSNSLANVGESTTRRTGWDTSAYSTGAGPKPWDAGTYATSTGGMLPVHEYDSVSTAPAPVGNDRVPRMPWNSEEYETGRDNRFGGWTASVYASNA
jgi:hypothetical protein